MTKIFITGGNGFIGSRVVGKLCGRGYDVRCLVRPASDIGRIGHLPVEFLVGDLADRAALERGVHGCTGCIHLASVSSWNEIDGPDVVETVVEGTRRMVTAVATAGIRLVYVSSASAVNGSKRPRVFNEDAAFELDGSGLRYAIAKHAAEAVVLAAARHGLDAVVVNPAETYGPDDREWVTAGPIREVLQARTAVAVRGGTSIAHVDDVAEGVVLAFERGRVGKRYILGGENVTVEQLVRTTLLLAGRPGRVIVVPASLLRVVVSLCALLRIRPPLPPPLVGYATRFWFMDSTRAQRELGFHARGATDTLASVVEWISTLDTRTPPPDVAGPGAPAARN